MNNEKKNFKERKNERQKWEKKVVFIYYILFIIKWLLIINI